MSLLTRVTNLRTAAIAADDVVQIKTRTGDLKTLSDRLELPAQTLPDLITGLGDLAVINVTLDADTIEDVAEVVAGMRTLASTLPGMPVDAPLDVPKLQVKAVESFTKELRVFLEANWINYRDQELPPINEELLGALAAGGLDVEDVRNELISAQTVLMVLKFRDIPGDGDVAKFKGAVEKLRACGEKVSTLVSPDLAEGILKAQSDEGIPFSWFTPERITALTELGIADRFQVRLR